MQVIHTAMSERITLAEEFPQQDREMIQEPTGEILCSHHGNNLYCSVQNSVIRKLKMNLYNDFIAVMETLLYSSRITVRFYTFVELKLCLAQSLSSRKQPPGQQQCSAYHSLSNLFIPSHHPTSSECLMSVCWVCTHCAVCVQMFTFPMLFASKS